MEQILERLDGVRRHGKDRYMACCPVHQDKSPSMMVTDKGDKITMYCFGCGAKGPEIIKAIGLPTSVIFKDSGAFDKQSYLLGKTETEDKMMIAVYDSAVTRGEVISHDDFRRYRLAKSREELRSQQA